MTGDTGGGAEAGSEAGGWVSIHRPVLLAEVLDVLELRPDAVVVDGTVGGGGHAAAILDRLDRAGRLVGLDRDAAVLDHARRSLERVSRAGGGGRFVLHHASYSRMQEVLANEGISGCDRVLLDLGVSSFQLDTAARGFSFAADGPLDMRMDRSAGIPAAAWLQRVPEAELARVLRDFGEERYAARVARAIVGARQQAPLQRTTQLAEVVRRAIPGRRGRIHPATRTFQAIRIVVNDELGELQRGLDAARHSLRRGGRLVVLSFHSLEDRLVKQYLRAHFDLPFRRAIQASAAEVARNPRARSARLRCGVQRGES